ncbi:CPBP family intramembrane glutamic endopeptidase [Salinadaptatus halalkaliphilus]|nr:CPBP family intramembrane glutamic endopeptidase [Salinadaptatus halalkaliphilus]
MSRRARLEATSEPLADRSLPWVLVVPFVPVVAVVVTIAAGYTLAMGDDPGFPPQFANLPLGIAGVAVVGFLYWRWDRATWRASAVFRRPSRNEIGASLLATVVGIAFLIAFNRLARTLGVAPHDPGTAATTLGLVSLAVGSLLVAPVVEEILFRGLLLGHLISRGYGILVAAALSILLFGLMHVFVAGLSSVIATAVLGTLLTALRLWYDNLVGAWLMHLLVNCWAVLVALAVLPTAW